MNRHNRRADKARKWRHPPMNLKLRFLDRLALQAILPVKGSYETMVAVKSIKDRTEITAAERQLSSMKQDPQTGNVQWNNAADSEKDFTFDAQQSTIIKEQLKAINDAGNLVQEHLTLYKAVMLDAEPATVQ